MTTRLEKVIVDAEDRFSGPIAGMAASAALFRRELDRGDKDVTRFNQNIDRSGKSIDRFSGRLGIALGVFGALGPALIPISAVAIPAITGLAAQFGFAAVGAGTALAAFQGVGGALEAMNKAHLEPTTENLQAAKIAMQAISPEARELVKQLRSMGPEMKGLRDVAAAGLFPGVVEGLQSMESLLPKVERILGAVSGELGDIAADVGVSLASDRWSDFFEFLATDAPSALRDMATAAGSTAHAMAEMWMAFDPLNDDFSAWMVDATGRLDDWATGLDQTQGFAEFVDYIRTTGPQVGETLGSIANAMVQIVTAAAPMGGPVLSMLELVADAVAAIADSPFGAKLVITIATLALFNRTLMASAALMTRFGAASMAASRGAAAAGMFAAMSTRATQARTAVTGLRRDVGVMGSTFMTAGAQSQRATERMAASQQRVAAAARSMGAATGKAALGVAALSIVSTESGRALGITNTAMLGLMGLMVGGPLGAGIGAAVGGFIDLTHANDGLNDSLAQLNAVAGKVDFSTFNAQLAQAQKQVDDLKNVTGFGDLLSDTAKAMGGALQGKSFLEQKGAAQGEIRDAEQRQQMAGRNAGAAASNRQAAASAAAAAAGYRLTAAGAREAAASVAQMTSAINAANAAMNDISAEDALRTAMLDARDLAKESGKVLSASGNILAAHQRAGIAARGALVTFGSAAQQAGEKMKAGFGKTNFLDQKRKQFVDIAKAMGMSGPAARRMANDFGLIDRLHAKPKVTEQGADSSRKRIGAMRAEIARIKDKHPKINENGAGPSAARIRALRAAIAALRDRTIHISVVRHGGEGGFDGVRKPASGGQMIARYPGETRGPRDDTIPAYLSHREYVHPVVAVDHYGERFMEDIRARRFPVPEGYAAGGIVEAETFANGGQARRRRGDGGGNLAGLRAELARLRLAIAGNTKAVSAQTAAREALASKRSEVASTVTGKFTSDLFGESNVWSAGGGAGGAMGVLKADIAKANAFKSLLYGLSKRGLDGDALAELASTGDVGKAQAFASMSNKDLGTYESLYRQRASAAAGVGSYAGMASYSAEQAAATKVLLASLAVQKQQNTRLAQLEKAIKRTGGDVARGVNRAAANGKRGRKG